MCSGAFRRQFRRSWPQQSRARFISIAGYHWGLFSSCSYAAPLDFRRYPIRVGKMYRPRFDDEIYRVRLSAGIVVQGWRIGRF